MKLILCNPGSHSRIIYKKNLYEALKTVVRIGLPIDENDTIVMAWENSNRLYIPIYLYDAEIYTISGNYERFFREHHRGRVPFYLILKSMLKLVHCARSDSIGIEICSGSIGSPIHFNYNSLFQS